MAGTRGRPRAGWTGWMGSAAVVAAAACGGGESAPPPPPPPEVAVVTVRPERVPETFEFTAEVQPFRRVEVRARVDGVVVERPFAEGQVVQAGQVLYRIDRVRPEAAYRSALARRDNARRTVQRLEPLLQDNAVAQQDVDDARTELEAAEAALAAARQNLDDTVVRAEIAGRVARTSIEVGGRVTGPQELLTTIDVLEPVYVSFRPSTQQLLAWRENPQSRDLLRPGSPLKVEVTLPDGTVLPGTGTLDFVAPALDPATGTQEFRAKFANADRLLVPGQFVRVRLGGFVRPDAIAVPQRAVLQALGRQYVYVVAEGDTVRTRDVTPGPWSGSRWIIEKGLGAGDRVIVDGAQKAGPGRAVKPVPLADSLAAQATAPVATTSGGE